jgi:hypothetical protein
LHEDKGVGQEVTAGHTGDGTGRIEGLGGCCCGPAVCGLFRSMNGRSVEKVNRLDPRSGNMGLMVCTPRRHGEMKAWSMRKTA